MSELAARADVRGRQIDVDFTWVAPGDRPALRLLRRRYDVPNGPSDGLVVFDSAAYFPDPAKPNTSWGKLERDRYLIAGASTEGGLAQVEVLFAFAVGSTQPSHATINVYDASTLVTIDVPNVTRRATTVASSAQFGSVQTIEIFALIVGVEASAGKLVVSTVGTGAPPIANHVSWTSTGQSTLGGDFDWTETTTETLAANVDPNGRFVFRASKYAAGNLLLRQTTLTETLDPNSGDWTRALSIADKEPSERTSPSLLANMVAERPYAYAVFASVLGSAFQTDPEWTAVTAPTGDYGLPDRMYQLLPSVHRNLDEPTPAQTGTGQLRRFLQIFGGGMNQLRSLGEALKWRQDVYHASFEHLPELAHWIGWAPDETISGRLRRNDILMAPTIFQSLGTIPSLQAIVNRATPIADNGVSGWDIKLKEFVNNILLTNAVEPIRLWEIWESDSTNGTAWGGPTRTTQTDFFDGRPTAAIDSSGVTWLFWHSDRSGRRELWFQRLDGVDLAPRRVTSMTGATDDSPNASFVDEYPAAIADGTSMRVFWSSNRNGRWNVWTRTLTGASTSIASKVTDSVGSNRNPAVVSAGGTLVHVYWQSDRRGLSDIWQGTFDAAGPVGALLTGVIRLTTSDGTDTMPAVVASATTTELFFVRARGNNSRVLGGPVSIAITSATDATPIVVTSAAPHGLLTGQTVAIAGVLGNTAANGVWAIITLSPTQFSLTSSAGNAAYTSGGIVQTPVNVGPTAFAVIDATNATPIVVTTGSPHGFVSGQAVVITEVAGNTAANGKWTIASVSPTQFSLNASVGNGTYTSGGAATSGIDVFAAADVALTVAQRALVRDEAPAAATFGGVTHLFFHSNRGDGRWRVWTSTQLSPTTWSAPIALSLGQVEADKEPAAVVAASTRLRVFFRTQRSGRRFQSRTVDTKDLAAIQRGNVADKWHYTYDTGRKNTNWYARDAVGVYLSPPAGSVDATNMALVSRISAFMEPFRPISARFVWLYKFDKPTPI